MKIIIHAGMPKTGSSSIQNHFVNSDTSSLGYFPWYGPNHSALFILLFEKLSELKNFHGFRLQGRSEEFLKNSRDEWWKKTKAFLETSNCKNYLLSAESISGASDYAVNKLQEFCKNHFDETQVILYVRPPRSFMSSAFQEVIKGDTVKDFDAKNYWPFYRHRIEKLDKIFGEENVSIREFSRDKLEGGDVVRDFAYQTSLQIPENTPKRANESLPLEAIAALYIQRSRGDGFVTDCDNAVEKNVAFIESIRSLGSTPFSFSDEFLDVTSKKFPGDLDWISNRMGRPLVDKPLPDGSVIISSEDDMCNYALTLGNKIQDLRHRILGESLAKRRGNHSLSNIASMMNDIRSYHYRDHLNRRSVNMDVKQEISHEFRMKVAYSIVWAKHRESERLDEMALSEEWSNNREHYMRMAEQAIYMMRKQGIALSD